MIQQCSSETAIQLSPSEVEVAFATGKERNALSLSSKANRRRDTHLN